MTYMILDSFGNAVDSFDDELSARAALHALVTYEPDAADHLVMLRYDAAGLPVGDAMTVFDVPPGVEVEESEFLTGALNSTLRRPRSVFETRYFGSLLPAWDPAGLPATASA